MSQPLISVIVPIYNVAPYLRKCLDSLKNQTMKEIEIICIDDGSTDSSGRIADEYVSDEWPKFRIIHTENRGLSATRNRGIDEARAEWIMFVDSDDYVEDIFCEVPYKSAIENHADLVIYEYINERGLKKKKKAEAPTGLVDEITAHEFGRVAVWNKLYKKALFNSIHYPEGYVYEDIATTHKLVHEAKMIILLQTCLYHYTSRKGSITNTKTLSHKRDAFVSIQERYNFLMHCGYSVEKIESVLLGAAIGYLSASLPYENAYWVKARDVVESSHGMPKELTLKQKIALIVWRINPAFFYFVSKLSGRLRNPAKSVS